MSPAQVEGTWPSAEQVVLEYLREAVPDLTWLTELYEGWKGPVGLIEQIPGGGTGDAYDEESVIDVGIYAGTRAVVWELVERVKPAMFLLPMRATTASVDHVTMSSTFGMVPYSNRSVRRAVGTYRLTMRPQIGHGDRRV